MPRNPADVKVLRGQDHYWESIRRLHRERGEFSVTDVYCQTSGDRKTAVREYMKRLELGGFIRHSGMKGNTKMYTLKHDRLFAPRVKQDGTEFPPTRQEQMWRTMKMLKAFTVHDLAVAASTESVHVSPVHAEDYIRHLVKSGYVRRVRGAFRFVPGKNTGPRAPLVQRIKHVFDPNLNKVVWRSGHDE